MREEPKNVYELFHADQRMLFHGTKPNSKSLKEDKLMNWKWVLWWSDDDINTP